MGKKIKLSPCSLAHAYKLVGRGLLFLAALLVYILHRVRYSGSEYSFWDSSPLLLGLIWLLFLVEMVFRLFPSPVESMGCQKQFARNHLPRPGAAPAVRRDPRPVLAVALVWLGLNACVGLVYFLGWIDEGILILLSLAYSVCDMVCILFFCPFQTWFLKNKCCTACPIYNWDYAMMFTPLAFLPGLFTWSLLAMGLVLLIVWEVRVRRYPERFSEATNQSLGCDRCQEKLCHHKRQLRRFWEKQRLRISGR